MMMKKNTCLTILLLMVLKGIFALPTDRSITSTGSIGDFVWEDMNGNGRQDSGEPGIAGINITLTGTESNGVVVNATTITSSTGTYSFTNLQAGTYKLTFDVGAKTYRPTTVNASGSDTDNNSDLFFPSLSTASFTLADSETKTNIDAGFYLPCTIGDFLWYDINQDGLQYNENAIFGIEVDLYKNIDGNKVIVASTQSFNQIGGYKFGNLIPGTYELRVKSGQALIPTIFNQGIDEQNDSDINPSTGFSSEIVLTSGEINNSIDIGFIYPTTCPDSVILEPTYLFEGDELTVDYYVNSDVTSILGFQLGFEFDHNIFKALNVKAPQLSSFNESSYGLTTNGQLIISWVNGAGSNQSIDVSKPLFQVRYKILDPNGIGFIKLNKNIPTEYIYVKESLTLIKCIHLDGNAFNPTFGIAKGRVTLDDDKNCSVDANPSGLEHWMVVFTQGNKKYYRVTNAQGEYSAGLTPGLYNVTAMPINAYYNVCSTSHSITITENQTISDIDFLVQRQTECAIIDTEVTAPFLRRCFDNTYTVSYQNTGTIVANDASIDIVLDNDLIFVSSSRPYMIDGDTIHYELGDVNPGASGIFTFVANVNCNTTQIGQTHCVTAKAYPNNPCVVMSGYAGSKIEAKAICDEITGKVKLTLTNVGTAAMPTALQYIVTEDDVMSPPINYQLDALESLQVDQDATGATWGIITQQEVNYPTTSRPSAFIEGCRLNGQGSFTTGFVNSFEANDGEPFVDILCLETIGSFDPNDITGYPRGYTEKKYVEKSTKLEYLVRFQNTGTDTAFNIVVRNIIDNKLNVETFKMKGASHEYTFDFINQRELVVKFKDVLLVDSNRNEALSHGYFMYEIYPVTTLKDEDRLENLADIYFDFNAPVRTNLEHHTIGRPIFISSVTQIDKSLPLVNAYPNPTTQSIIVDMPEGDYSYEIYDEMGRIVSASKLVNNRIECSQLSVGIYTAKIIHQSNHITSVRFIKN
jgi:hypothetical protein